MTTAELIQQRIDKKYPDLNQGEIAEKLEVAPGTLSEWLNGRYEPSLDSLRALAGKLRCRVASLIGDETAAGKAS